LRRGITKESNVQKVSKFAAYAFGSLFCAALAPHAGAQCSVVGDQVICTQDFTPGGISTASATSGSGTLSQFDSSLYMQANGTPDPLVSVTLTLTGVTTANGTLQNTQPLGGTTETYNISQLVSISGAGGGVGNNDLTIGSFTSQFGPQSLTLTPQSTGSFGTGSVGNPGPGSGTGSINSSNAVVLSDFTGAGTFTVDFKSGAGFTQVTGGTDFLINGVPVEDVQGTVTYSLEFAPVPELSSSIGLAALVLGGGALGLRARRRAHA
jgi:hypothetical protein